MKIPSSFKKLLAIPMLLGLALYFNSCKKDNPAPAPVITSFSPVSGLEGATVTITGKNFSATASSNTVMFNNVAATVSAATATTITVTVPVGATTGPISVGTSGSTATSSTDFTILFPPTASSFAPTSGAPGATFIITGTNFSTTPGDNTVKINNVVATVTAATATQLTVTVPTGATTGKVTVTTNGATTTSTNDFTVLPAPTIVSFSPATLAIGGTLTITGTDFSTNLADNVVKINNVMATVTAATATQLTLTVPADATTGTITVTASGVTVTSASGITIVPAPTITSFSPTSGAPGSTVTITGTNFSTNPAANVVKINNVPVTVTAATATQLTLTVPAGASSGKITVTTYGVIVTSATDFVVPPTITSFLPTSGAPGSTVIITGTNFSTNPADNVVMINNVPVKVTAATATQLTITVPAGASSGKFTVTTSGVTVTSITDFLVSPSITSFSPAYALPGATVTITGTNFSTVAANNSVTFNGKVATVTASTPTQLTVTVPAGATTGAIAVTVSMLTGTSASNFEVLIDIPRTGLVAFYPFNGNANDASGNALHGTLTNGPTLAADRNGTANKAYSLDGTNDYITMGNPVELQINTAITISGWINISNTATLKAFINKLEIDATGNTVNGYRINHDVMGNGSPAMVVHCFSAKNMTMANFLGNNLANNTWVFVALVIDGIYYTYYHNGVYAQGQATTATILTDGTKGDLLVGSSGGGFFLKGLVDDIAIYNRALTATEINQLYTQTVTKY